MENNNLSIKEPVARNDSSDGDRSIKRENSNVPLRPESFWSEELEILSGENMLNNF